MILLKRSPRKDSQTSERDISNQEDEVHSQFPGFFTHHKTRGPPQPHDQVPSRDWPAQRAPGGHRRRAQREPLDEEGQRPQKYLVVDAFFRLGPREGHPES